MRIFLHFHQAVALFGQLSLVVFELCNPALQFIDAGHLLLNGLVKEHGKFAVVLLFARGYCPNRTMSAV